jgi:hypothetical protein
VAILLTWRASLTVEIVFFCLVAKPGEKKRRAPLLRVDGAATADTSNTNNNNNNNDNNNSNAADSETIEQIVDAIADDAVSRSQCLSHDSVDWSDDTQLKPNTI